MVNLFPLATTHLALQLINARSLHNLYLFSSKSKILCTCIVLQLRCR